jgi:hypothetical protein
MLIKEISRILNTLPCRNGIGLQDGGFESSIRPSGQQFVEGSFSLDYLPIKPVRSISSRYTHSLVSKSSKLHAKSRFRIFNPKNTLTIPKAINGGIVGKAPSQGMCESNLILRKV